MIQNMVNTIEFQKDGIINCLFTAKLVKNENKKDEKKNNNNNNLGTRESHP